MSVLYFYSKFSSFISMQNTKSTKGQIKYLVYCMENAILNLPQDQEQMVWLIDFHGFSMSNISIKVTRETAHVLQEHYPERLGVAILYDPPKIFEPFWTVFSLILLIVLTHIFHSSTLWHYYKFHSHPLCFIWNSVIMICFNNHVWLSC